jgi:hypothetical protein
MPLITDFIIFLLGSLSCFGLISRFVDPVGMHAVGWVGLYLLGQLAWCALCVLTYRPNILPGEDELLDS